MPHPVLAAGHAALITGAGSGIGLAIAQLCARHSMKLALVDNNKETLAVARSTLESDVDAEIFIADVADLERWKKLKVEIGQRFGAIHFLVLNAGTAARGGWEDVEHFHKTFDTNFFGVTNGLATFLPTLRALASGASPRPYAIVITGSKQGITNPPGNPAYNASKAALRSLAESLAFDLRGDSPHGSVHLLVPGWTFTGLTGGGGAATKAKPEGAWAPAQVAGYLERKMDEGQFYVMCPDNDVSEDLDRRRVLWSAGDLIEGRPPLTRWREDWKDRAQEGVERIALPGAE